MVTLAVLVVVAFAVEVVDDAFVVDVVDAEVVDAEVVDDPPVDDDVVDSTDEDTAATTDDVVDASDEDVVAEAFLLPPPQPASSKAAPTMIGINVSERRRKVACMGKS